MRFERDPDKARRNLVEHGISFELARRVAPDRIECGEQRWRAIGLVGPAVIVVVVHAYPNANADDRVRIIGALKATRHERRRYERDGV